MVDQIAHKIIEFFQNKIPNELIVFFISLLPILELRGGLIAASLFQIPWLKAFIICFIGNIIPIPFILLFIKKIFKLLKEKTKMRGFIEKLEKRTLNKSGKIQKYGPWALLIFVAVPLPGTGGWTGALLAALMEIDFKKAFPIICIGVFIAGFIMTLLSYGVLGNLIH